MRPFIFIVVSTFALVLAACGAAADPSTAASDAPESQPTESGAPSASAAANDEPPADAVRLEDGATIAMSAFAFGETAVIVPAGATLTFTNEDNVGHTVTHGIQGFAVDDPSFDQPVMAGDSTEITFDEPGRYDITCVPHPIMQMTVFVEG